MSIFNEDQIRQAIDRFQETHPVSFAFDIHHIRDEESLDIIKRTIDDLCEKAERDSEMHIIMEMAKQYMNGAKPSYDRKEGEWITIKFARKDLNCPEKSKLDFVQCPFCETIHQGRHHFCSYCGAKME